MSEPYDIAGQPLTEEQRQALAARTAAAAAASPGPAAEAAQTAQIIEGSERGPLLPAEEQIDALMAQLRAQSEQLASLGSQVSTLQKQQEEAQAASGGPLVVRYAQGAADKLAAMQTARPDHAAGHFDPATEAAGQLVDAAKQHARDGSRLDDVRAAVAAIERFINRTHSKQGGAQLDFSAVADDVDAAATEAQKIAA